MAVTPTADLVQVDVLMGATARLSEDRVTKRSAVMELPDPPGRLEVPRVWCSRRARTGPSPLDVSDYRGGRREGSRAATLERWGTSASPRQPSAW